eukprot:2720705-Rhodomonas_salina.1
METGAKFNGNRCAPASPRPPAPPVLSPHHSTPHLRITQRAAPALSLSLSLLSLSPFLVPSSPSTGSNIQYCAHRY